MDIDSFLSQSISLSLLRAFYITRRVEPSSNQLSLFASKRRFLSVFLFIFLNVVVTHQLTRNF